jgi:hypothetical protein
VQIEQEKFLFSMEKLDKIGRGAVSDQKGLSLGTTLG